VAETVGPHPKVVRCIVMPNAHAPSWIPPCLYIFIWGLLLFLTDFEVDFQMSNTK